MWHSIKTIHHPRTLAEAEELLQQGGTCFAGGAYLTAQRRPEVHTLVVVKELLPDKVHYADGRLVLGAGVTLQTWLEAVQQQQLPSVWAQAIRYSCPSRNIRNQRTVGGEFHRQRPESELFMLTLACAASVLVWHQGQEREIPLTAWNRQGILLEVRLDWEGEKLGLERFAVLESAPAMVITAGCGTSAEFQVAVGGRDVTPRWGTVRGTEVTYEGEPPVFADDHLGSGEYKKHLVQVGIERLRQRL